MLYTNTNMAEISSKSNSPSLSQRTNQASVVEEQFYAATCNRNRTERKFTYMKPETPSQAVIMKITTFWDVPTCSVVDI
jgi:hypothetical protein